MAKRWTKEDDKRFELALVNFPENSPYRFENIAKHLKRPVDEVRYYYKTLVDDINLIESGQVPIIYPDSVPSGSRSSHQSKNEKESKRGIPWSDEEHRLFVDGLMKHGVGQWKRIARDSVKSRTSTQVASHAQKFFSRANMSDKMKKRPSIHDTPLQHPIHIPTYVKYESPNQ